MATAAVLSPHDCQAVLQRWKTEGVRPEEREELVQSYLAVLSDESQLNSLVDNIAGIARKAADLDQAFDDAENIINLVILVVSPAFQPYKDEWQGLKRRWRHALRTSMDNANMTADVLKRFDEVYLEKVEKIETEQDRLACIELLRPFVNELNSNDQSDKLSREFLELKRDVADFVRRFNILSVSSAVTPMLAQIDSLDQEIKAANKAIGASGGVMLAALGVGAAASPVVGSLVEQRDKKIETLKEIRRCMNIMNDMVTPAPVAAVAASSYRGGDYNITAPDIGSMLDSLGTFADIWASIRSQTVQFVGELQGGLDAVTNMRFKREVRLAREQSRPLKDGLNAYVRELSDWV